KNLSHNSRYLQDKDFCEFEDLNVDSYISISIEFYGKNLSEFPNLHAIKTSDETLRITYVFIHKSKIISTEEEFDTIEIKDFQWRLYGGGDDFDVANISTLSQISFNDI